MGDSAYRSARFWRKAPKVYPNVCTSLGTKIGFFHDKHWWYPTGHVQEEFQKIDPEILAQLGAVFTDTYSSIVYYRLYMIGRSAEAAIPTIMFFCEEKEPRKKAKKVVDEGGVLSKLPGFRTGHQASQPSTGSLVQPATNRTTIYQQDPDEDAFASEVYYDTTRSIEPIGLPIYIKHGTSWRKASANLVFEGRKRVLLSVAHVFLSLRTPSQTTSLDDDSDFDLGSGSEDEHELYTVAVTSRASVSSPEETSDTTSLASPGPSTKMQTTEDAVDESDVRRHLSPTFQTPESQTDTGGSLYPSMTQPDSLEYVGSLMRYSCELDWALVEISNDSKVSSIFQSVTRFSVTSEQKRMETSASSVVVQTSHGPVRGQRINNAMRMRLPNSRTFENVYELKLATALSWGDCGAPMFLDNSQLPRGFIVASSSDRTVAYVTVAAQVFVDSNTQWDLATTAMFELSSDHPGKSG